MPTEARDADDEQLAGEMSSRETAAGLFDEPEPGELRFDMFEAELTHVGNLCSFEVLMQRTGLADRAFSAIAEIVFARKRGA